MYTRAIVRRPGRNFAEGITMSNLGQPDFNKALEQHAAYCEALIGCGVELTVLDADKRYPDGCFVEDTAVPQIVPPGEGDFFLSYIKAKPGNTLSPTK